MIHSIHIIKDGLPLVVKSCSPQASKFEMDEARLAGLLAAMNTFCAELGSEVGEIQSLRTSANLQFSFMKQVTEDNQVLFVACHDGNVPAERVRRVLARVASKFLAKFQTLSGFTGQINAFDEFSGELPGIVNEIVEGSIASRAPTSSFAHELPELPPLPEIPDPSRAIEALASNQSANYLGEFLSAQLFDSPLSLNVPDYNAIVPVFRGPSLRQAQALCSGAAGATILRCITGAASIADIAHVVGMDPDIVFRFCRNFMNYGVVGFTRDN